jgi:hypothetical protein
MFSAGMPAAPKRSRTLSSEPHVTGLMKPSGGGDVYSGQLTEDVTHGAEAAAAD